MFASVLAWAEPLPADFEFLVRLPFGVGVLGLAGDIGSRVRARATLASRRRHR